MISSSFFFVMPDGRAMVYGDRGVIPDPDATQLASIAVSSARTFAELTGQEPRVAMLSFSTKGSAEHGKVMHDPSRGSSVDDIVNVAVIAALQAQLF